jgi:hypothetical protein
MAVAPAPDVPAEESGGTWGNGPEPVNVGEGGRPDRAGGSGRAWAPDAGTAVGLGTGDATPVEPGGTAIVGPRTEPTPGGVAVGKAPEPVNPTLGGVAVGNVPEPNRPGPDEGGGPLPGTFGLAGNPSGTQNRPLQRGQTT